VEEEAELCEQLSRQHLEHQIQEFQDWQLLQSPQEECVVVVVVVCPLCRDTNLVELPAGGGVACPNAACCLTELPQAKSLENVRERLGAAFEMHNCSSPLELVLKSSTGDTANDEEHLVANCHVCDYHLVIV
jgi:hypothetical protein